MVVGAAIAAAFVLPGCAPAGYNAADYGGAQPAANAVDGSPSAPAADKGADKVAAPGAPKLSANQITSELLGTKVARMGEVIEDQNGFVLYRFDSDTNKPKSKSACEGDCAKVWHPALTENGKPKLKGVSSDVVGTVTRADGSKQLTVKGWPLYRYVGDLKAGTWKGQNVGGKWFVIKPDGAKNLTCLPKISKPVAPPAEGDSSGGGDTGNGDSGGSGSAGSDYSY
jgi:predicted lipoprotein with Yx(FWY)xxD motif